MNHTLETLLPILAIADPSICLPCEGIEPGLPFLVRVDKRWIPLASREMPTESAIPTLVERAVRDRLREKGWPWKLIATGDTITAVVNPEPERPLQVAAGADGAIAIAAAYLKALGAEV